MEIISDMLEFGAFLLVVMTAGFSGWIGTILVKRWQKGSEGASRRELDAVSARLERIEQAVETVAVEVERVAEAQRFATRLLAERHGIDGVASPAMAPPAMASVPMAARPRDAVEPR